MKIYVLRHGLTELNKKKILNGQIDEPLTPEGFKQAEAFASLMPKSVKHIYVSPLLRTKQTAEIVNLKSQLPISEYDGLREIHMGSFAGKSWTGMESGMELKKKHRTIRFDYRRHGGESAKEVKKRILEFLKSINGKYDDYEVLIITHGGIIRTFYWLEHRKHITFDLENVSLQVFDVDKILKNKV